MPDPIEFSAQHVKSSALGSVPAVSLQCPCSVPAVSLQCPGGELFATGLVEYSALALPTPGWQESYAIIGCTGKYAGARGSGTMTLLEDGKTFKVVLKIRM